MDVINERQDILNCIKSKELDFYSLAERVYSYQRKNNSLFGKYVNAIGKISGNCHEAISFNFLPVSFFKGHSIQSSSWIPEAIFKSSGTSAGPRSRHLIRNVSDYHKNAEDIWTAHFGELSKYHILTLLPNYHANPDSSLISMVNHFGMLSSEGRANNYLTDHVRLFRHIRHNMENDIPTVLFGVRFALLEYMDAFEHPECKRLLVVETGGMKGTRGEMTNDEFYSLCKNCFKEAAIVSEYGMTECLSQMYNTDQMGYSQNARIRAIITDLTDPFCILGKHLRGRINLIDLANLDTISFIGTDDLGFIDHADKLHVVGRIDQCEIRGCNYLTS